MIRQLTVLTPGSAAPLMSAAAMKPLLGVVGASLDATLATLAAWASDEIEKHCGRAFAVTRYQEDFSGTDTSEVNLSRWPLAGPATVSYQGDEIADWTVSAASRSILYRRDGWWRAEIFTGMLEGSPRPDSEIPDHRAVYPAGYLLAGDTAPGWAPDAKPLPGHVERAAFVTVQAWLRSARRRGVPEIASRTESASDGSRGQVVISYVQQRAGAAPASLALPQEAVDLLRTERV